MRIALSGLKLKFRSRLMSTSGPTASRKVPMSVSMCRSSGVVTYWSVVPSPPPKPPKKTSAGSPGSTMFVFSAV